MKRVLPMLLCCALPGLPGTAGVAHAAELRPFQTSYAFITFGMNAGTASFELRHEDGAEWTYSTKTEPRGIFHMIARATASGTSRMSIGPEGVRPLRFEFTEGNAASGVTRLNFDWQANHARGKVEGQDIDLVLHPGVQDDLSIQVALISALAADAAPSGFSVFDKNGIRDYSYTREGTAMLKTPLGEISTVIYRSQRSGSPRSTRYWCAPEYGYIPVRAEQRRLDEVQCTMELRSLHRD